MGTIQTRIKNDPSSTTYSFDMFGAEYQALHTHPPRARLLFKQGENIVFEVFGSQGRQSREIQTPDGTKSVSVGLGRMVQKPLFSATPHPSLLFELEGRPLKGTISDPAAGLSERRIAILLVAFMFLQGILARVLPETVTVGMFRDAIIQNMAHIAGFLLLLYSAWSAALRPTLSLSIAAALGILELGDLLMRMGAMIARGQLPNPASAIGFFLARWFALYYVYHALQFQAKRRQFGL